MSVDGGPGTPDPAGFPRAAGPGPWPGPGWAGGYYVPPKPGVIPLRPLTVGDVIGGVFATLKKYARAVYYPLLAVVSGAFVVVAAAVGVSFLLLNGLYDDVRNQDGYRPTGGQVAGLVTAIVIVALLMLLGLIAAATVASATSTSVIRHAVLGRPVTGRQIWAESRPYLWRVLGSQLLVGLGGVGALLVSLLPALLLGLATHSGAAVAVAMLCVIPAWLFAVYLQVRLVLVVPALVLENQPTTTAIRRAWKLNHGAWWRSLGIPYLVNMIGSFGTQAIAFVFMMIGFIPFYISTAGQPTDDSGLSPAPPVYGIVLLCVFWALGLALAIVLALPLAPLTHGLLYADRRIRTENLASTLATEVGIPLWALTPPEPRSPYGWTGPGAQPAAPPSETPAAAVDREDPEG